MGREVKRVALDFDWPLGKIWEGFQMPDDVRLPDCPDCKNGYSRHAERLFDIWYGYYPFRPEHNGSTPLTIDTPVVRAAAERNIGNAPDYYGDGETAIQREARRLADMWNSQWCHHLNYYDVAALLDADRLWDLTRTFTPGKGWAKPDTPIIPTPEEVNTWSIATPFGHDAINAGVVVSARCEREGFPDTCATCNGSARVGTPEQKATYEAWEPTDPPAGEGWQIWETVSEGSPVTPVFATPEALARYLSRPRDEQSTSWMKTMPYDNALRFVNAGWAPTLIGSSATGIQTGYESAGQRDAQPPT